MILGFFMDGRSWLHLPIHVFDRFHGREIRITGGPGTEASMRVLQTSEPQCFSSDACMAREGMSLDYVIDLQTFAEHAGCSSTEAQSGNSSSRIRLCTKPADLART